MRQRWLSTLAVGAATATLMAGLPAAPGQAAPRPDRAGAPQAAPAGSSAQTVSVTLITGDRVTVHGGDRTSIQAGPGRAGTKFIRQNIKDQRYVIPADALALIQSGRVDRRLFDVAALTRFGYDDRTRDLPLIVSYPGSGKRQAAAARSAVDGARVVRDLTAVGALAVRADRVGRTTLWDSLTAGGAADRGLRAGVDKIWLDGKRAVDLDVSVPQIGTRAAWEAGLDGKGVTVAVLDTGIDVTHPDLAGQVTANQNFTEEVNADDLFGHGTHVASTIAGTGAASQGRYRGVAPGAKLLNGKVCDSSGGCPESAILAGMQWAAEQGAQVVNMSLGGGDTPEVDPMEQAVNDLTAAHGTLFVIAAGNSGSDATVGSPASADAALAVGAVDRDDKLADFSSRGPRVGDDAIKPEITAPGVEIMAAKATRSVIGNPAPVAGYTSLSGTSMATPHTAGAAAIIVQQHPGWTAQQRKTALMASAKPTPGVDVFGQGAGRVDVARAITQTIATDGGSVSFGRQLWPHFDDRPVAKQITYRNDGASPVTLSLTVRATGPDGSAAPAGLFALSASTVTVPANGRAQVTITADTSVDGPDGYYTGAVVGTAAGVQVQAPFAVNREPESYDVTFRPIGRDGAPADMAYILLTSLDRYDIDTIDASAGPVTVRLRKGDYGYAGTLLEGMSTEDRADDVVTGLADPRFTVSADATVQVDARTGRPVSVTVPNREAAPAIVDVGLLWSTDDFSLFTGVGSDRFDNFFIAQSGDDAGTENFISSVTTTFARPTADGSFRNSPYTYDLTWFNEGRMFTGFQRSVKTRDLATIHSTYAREATGVEGADMTFGTLENSGGVAVLLPFDLPFRRTRYINTEPGVGWEIWVDQRVATPGEWPELVSTTLKDRTTYRAGRTYRVDWNRAVFGPSVANVSARSTGGWANRSGDTIVAAVPLHSDGRGHIGFSAVTAARTALYRDGVLVGENAADYGIFEVPAEAADYRLEASAERGAPSTLSTRVSATWTFRSAHVAGEQPSRLPLSTVRFTPRVNQENTAPVGRRFDIPVTVDRQAGSAAQRNRTLTAEVSYDDGRTWAPARVGGRGDKRTVTVQHPGQAGFVSLRAKAVDSAGHTVTQTAIRAYRIG